MIPHTLHLPHRLTERFELAPLLAADPRRSWSQAAGLLPLFELRSQEKAFAKRLLLRKRNLHVFRSNQQLACGDFVVVDMSVTPTARRRALFVELKMGEALRALSPGHLQVRNWEAARRELCAPAEPGLDAHGPAEFLLGGEAQVLAYLGVRD